MNTKIISGVLASTLLLSMSPVSVMAETTSTTEPTGPSTEQTTQLKDTVIDIKDATMKATFGESTKTFTYTCILYPFFITFYKVKKVSDGVFYKFI
jgi:hypothetical protein